MWKDSRELEHIFDCRKMEEQMIEKELYPLSEAQQRIWVTQMLNPESSMFTIGGYMLIKGAVEIEKLQKIGRAHV